MRPEFPIGVTLKNWTITEYIAGDVARGRFRVRSKQGIGLLSTVWKQRFKPQELSTWFSTVAANVADVHHIGVLDTSELNHWGLVEAEPPGRPVAERRLDAANARRVLRELCEIAAGAHLAGFALRGLRPELVYVDDRLHVTGVAPRCEAFLMTGTAPSSGVAPCFDALYAAPEALDPRPAAPPADVFSIATMAAELVTGEHPFAGDNWQEQLYAMSGGQRRAWTGPADLGRVIDRALDRDPTRRPAVRELASALS